MTTKKLYLTEDSAPRAGVCLTGESVPPADTRLIPGLTETREKPKTRPTYPRTLFAITQPLCCVNKEHKEMKEKVFGYELILDLSECDLAVMSSKKKLAEYCDKLCKLIKMKKYGKALLPYFGLDKPQTKGYSLLQFIETSSITGHFSEYWRKSYINIFSCKKYDAELAKTFTTEFFGAKKVKARLLVR